MDSQAWAALAVIVPSVCTVVGTVIIAWMQSRVKTAVDTAGATAAVAADKASDRTEEVRDELKLTASTTSQKLGALKSIATDTHTLVNSNMEKALLISAIALRRVASMSNDVGDIDAANVAEAALAEHRKKQKIVDAAVERREEKTPDTLGETVSAVHSNVKEVKQDVKDIKAAGDAAAKAK